jgi:hypothetical protein
MGREVLGEGSHVRIAHRRASARPVQLLVGRSRYAEEINLAD